MKYVKSSCCALCIALLIGGCAFNADREGWNYDGSRPVELAGTEQFLPMQERNEGGQLLVYEAEPNPYTALKGRIDKEAVTAYIDARRAFKAQKFQFAEQLLAELVEEESKLSGPWVMRGDIAVAQDDLAQAVEHYVTALEINAINFNAWLRLAKTQRMRGHFNHAQNSYARALELWPDGPELHLNLGVLYDVYLNKPMQAQAHMEAYSLLNEGDNQEVSAWLEEVRQRTGIAKALPVMGPEGDAELAASEAAASASADTSGSQVPQARELADSKSPEE